MRTTELFSRAGVPETYREYNAIRKQLEVDWSNYFAAGRPGKGNHRNNWTDRDVVVLRLILDCQSDGIIDPTRGLLVDELRSCDEGTDLIVVEHTSGLKSFYRPRWETA